MSPTFPGRLEIEISQPPVETYEDSAFRTWKAGTTTTLTVRGDTELVTPFIAIVRDLQDRYDRGDNIARPAALHDVVKIEGRHYVATRIVLSPGSAATAEVLGSLLSRTMLVGDDAVRLDDALIAAGWIPPQQARELRDLVLSFPEPPQQEILL